MGINMRQKIVIDGLNKICWNRRSGWGIVGVMSYGKSQVFGKLKKHGEVGNNYG